MSSAQAPVRKEKRVLLFGKTGQGKSTIANMLVSGELLEHPKFKMGDGLIGVTQTCEGITSRGHHVVDTIGLGEDPSNRGKHVAHIPPEDAIDPAVEEICKFLESTQGEYSHILYVKTADRFDQLDKEIFKLFTRIFKGSEQAFGVIVTKCNNPEQWKLKNEHVMKEKYKPISPDRYVYVDFPPIDFTDEEMESILKKKRARSLTVLDDALDKFFESNRFRYFKPVYVDLSPEQRRRMAKEILYSVLKDIWDYMKQFSMVSLPVEAVAKSREMLDVLFSSVGARLKAGIRDVLLTPEALEQIGAGLRTIEV